MCGISGILLGPHAAARDLRADIAAMNQAQAHRGPDDEGSFFGPGMALGFRRLAIVDLSAAGHQPMSNADGTLTLVFNGEIYNHEELRLELRQRGHVFRSRSDTEVILCAYQEWGEACTQRFNGMWAFALWDSQRRRLWASRDRFGVKPFVYTEHQGRFVFASEVAGLRAAVPLNRAHGGKLHDYLAYGARTNDGQTLFEGVKELQPGHQLTWQLGQLSVSRWWSLPLQPEDARPDLERDAHYRDLLTDALRLRFRSDVPVALLQSGGLDSSALCALVDDQLAAGTLGQAQVQAFTALYPGQAEDESAEVAALMQVCPRVQWQVMLIWPATCRPLSKPCRSRCSAARPLPTGA
jgi:asparagine synthase (glutamine-hydrolysing)